MRARWNFRLGPLQFTSPVGVISLVAIVAALGLCCCAGVIGSASDDTAPDPTPAVIETSAPTDPEQTPPAEPEDPVEPAERAVVTAGAFCDTAGEVGVTKTGTAMVCRGPGDLRWRRPTG